MQKESGQSKSKRLQTALFLFHPPMTDLNDRMTDDPYCRFGNNSKSFWSWRPKLGVQSRLVPVLNTATPCLWGDSETTIVKLPYFSGIHFPIVVMDRHILPTPSTVLIVTRKVFGV